MRVTRRARRELNGAGWKEEEMGPGGWIEPRRRDSFGSGGKFPKATRILISEIIGFFLMPYFISPIFLFLQSKQLTNG